MSYLNAIYDALAQEEIEFVGEVQDLPGKWQRFIPIDKHTHDESIYVYIGVTKRYALIGDWRKHDKAIVIKLTNQKISSKEHYQSLEISKYYASERKKHIQECKDFYDTCIEANHEHPYLKRKQIWPFHIRQWKNHLILPLFNEHAELVGLQSISPNGEKKFKKGSIVKSSFLILGDYLTETIRICEGYATGMSLHLATDDTVFVAYCCTNLRNVSLIVRKIFPEKKIIICSDAKEKEISYALRAARVIGCSIQAPRSLNNTFLDFNDIHTLYGIEALQGQLYSYAFWK